MGMKLDGLANFGKALVALQADLPEIMDKLVVEEGLFAVKQARRICTEENIVSSNAYRSNFMCGTKAIRVGSNYKIDVFNNLDYAKHLEYGFRGHFVPGKYLSGPYREKFPDGMYVKFKPGRYTLERAIEETKRTQESRIERKLNKEIKKYLK